MDKHITEVIDENTIAVMGADGKVDIYRRWITEFELPVEARFPDGKIDWSCNLASAWHGQSVEYGGGRIGPRIEDLGDTSAEGR